MSGSRRQLAVRTLVPVIFGLVLAIGTGSALASADEVEYGDDEVSITVTITALDPCVVDPASCGEGDGDGELAATGSAIGMALGAGVLFVAIGAGAYAMTAYRRPSINA